MKPHLTASAVDIGKRNEDGPVARPPGRTPPALNKNTRGKAGSSQRSLVLASVNVRMHTLVLSGALDHRSAHALEAEIERLCEEGVTGITLDLRELTSIDSIGAAVIAFRCGLCKRRGYDFALIQGPRSVHSVFEQAGLAELLPFQEEEEEVAMPRPPALVLGHRSRDGCEQ
jgi:anti-anti-sigma factor